MLTEHAVAAIDCTENIAWQHSGLSLLLLLFGWLRWDCWSWCWLFLFLRLWFCFWLSRWLRYRLGNSFLLFFYLEHFDNRVECSGAVVADEHWCAAIIAFSKNLCTTSASALAIKQANLIVTQVAAANFLAWRLDLALFLFALWTIRGNIVLRKVQVSECKLCCNIEVAAVV